MKKSGWIYHFEEKWNNFLLSFNQTVLYNIVSEQ